MTITRAGFVGLGIMGLPMARNLLKAGFQVTVWNRTPGRADELAAEGATVAASPAEVARASEVTVSCVSDSPDVEAIALGPDGVIEGASPGSIYIDCSTISPAVARAVAGRLAEAGVQMLDAPVSGGDVGAQQGTLSIMVGGEADAFERSRPVFEAMGKTIVHVGPSGSGQVVKLCNQIAGGLHLLAMSEAIALCRSAGVDPARMLEAVSAGAGSSWMLQNLAPRVLQDDYRPGFMVRLQQKDLRLVLDAARETHAVLPGTALVHQLFAALEAEGRGDEGTQALATVIARLSGLDDVPDGTA
jgi:3-hydroxyisobutyrate dehydrogenase